MKDFYLNLKFFFRRLYYYLRFNRKDIRIDPTSWVSSRAILRCTGGGRITIGKFCEIHDYSMIDSIGGVIDLGDYCSLNPFAIIYGFGGTKIGNRVRIAAHSVIIPANHNYRSNKPLHEAGVTGKGIEIGDDTWLGTGVKILDGVTIGSRCVVGAGSVVNKDVPAKSIVLGIPGKFYFY